MAQQKITDAAYRAQAVTSHYEEGIFEVDDNAKVSWGDGGGAYVAAWVWVSDDDISPE